MCVVSSIVILNGDVVAGDPFNFKCSMFVRLFVRFHFRFYLVYLFVCLMSVRMKNTLIKTTETFIVCLFLINLLCTAVFGSFVFFSHTNTNTHVHHPHLFTSHYFIIGSRSTVYVCVCVSTSTHSIDKRKTQTTFHRLN